MRFQSLNLESCGERVLRKHSEKMSLKYDAFQLCIAIYILVKLHISTSTVIIKDIFVQIQLKKMVLVDERPQLKLIEFAREYAWVYLAWTVSNGFSVGLQFTKHRLSILPHQIYVSRHKEDTIKYPLQSIGTILPWCSRGSRGALNESSTSRMVAGQIREEITCRILGSDKARTKPSL